ncbi:MAG TPA: hypothetical protein ENF23_01965 [Methanosarcinales archaeon]|nr:MAG: hypothetical protein DRO03_00325 [Methanosarcinales archaeon]HDN65054.1 hypothetical protein [Methanosarcinales archaeon]
MAKKKRYRGHFCKVCRKILANEKFSGKGRTAHICKKCTRKLKARKSEEIAIACIYSVLSHCNLSRDDRKMLENYTHSRRERVRSEALTVLATFTRPTPSEEDEDFPDAD